MLDQLSDILSKIVDQFAVFFERADPVIEIAIYIFVGAFVVAFVVSRFRVIMRSNQWATLSIEEKTKLIERVAREAYTLAEWVFNIIDHPDTVDQRVLIGQQKKSHAVEFARRELRRLGATVEDQQIIGDKIELVVAQIKAQPEIAKPIPRRTMNRQYL